MLLKHTFCAIIFAVFVFFVIDVTDCKRGGGRRGGTYRGSSSVWGRNKQSQSGYDSYGRRAKQSPDAPQPELYKPSAPAAATNSKAASADFIHHEKNQAQVPSSKQKSPSSDLIQQEKSPALNANNKKPSSSDDFIQHEKSHQAGSQSAGTSGQRPIGWDAGPNKKVDGEVTKNVGWNVGNSNPNSGTLGHQPQPPPYTAHAGTSGHQHPPPAYTSHAGTLGHQHPPPAYTAHAGTLGHQQPPPSYTPHASYPNTGASSYYGTGNNYNYGSAHHPQQSFNQPLQGQYPNSNMGGVPQQNFNGGPYHNNMNGYGNAPMGGNHYGNMGGGGYGGGGYGGGGYGGGGYGGGYGNSFGGFGGGNGGFGMGGYGKSYGGGFGSGFGKHAIRNVLIGALVWNLVSGMTRRPYHVYNYYNNPEKVPQEIPLPANMIVLCSENVNSLCAPNTAPLCTNDNKILCVVLAQATVPCGENSAQKCVNSTVTCTNDADNPCGDSKEKTSTISIPCVTNATIIGKIVDNTTISFSGTGNILSNDGTTNLCVTTLALPEPEEVNQNKTLCVDKNTEGQNGTVPCLNDPSSVATSIPTSTPIIVDTSTKKAEDQ